MRYVTGFDPTVRRHGNYQYHTISHEDATRWLLKHHKTVKLVGINPQIANLIGRHIDCHLEPPASGQFPDIELAGEVLIVTSKQVQPHLLAQLNDVSKLEFAVLKHAGEERENFVIDIVEVLA